MRDDEIFKTEGETVMNRRMKTGLTCILIAALSVIITSCATTTMQNVWRAENYRGKLNKVFVIGIIKTPGVKRFFEDEFVSQLKTQGTAAIASYTVLPADTDIDREALVVKVKELGADGVLITRLVDIKTVETYVPSNARYAPPAQYQGGWQNYYTRSYGEIYQGGYTVKDEVLVVETNLYDVPTEKLVWSAISETFRDGSSNELIRSFIEVMIKSLSEEKLL